jgi:hypothetical protein
MGWDGSPLVWTIPVCGSRERLRLLNGNAFHTLTRDRPPDLPGLPGQEWSVELTDNVLILITDSALSRLSHNVFDMTRPPPTFPRANIPKLPLLTSTAVLRPHPLGWTRTENLAGWFSGTIPRPIRGLSARQCTQHPSHMGRDRVQNPPSITRRRFIPLSVPVRPCLPLSGPANARDQWCGGTKGEFS